MQSKNAVVLAHRNVWGPIGAPMGQVMRFTRRKPLGAASVLLLVAMMLMAVVTPGYLPDSEAIDVKNAYAPPSLAHPFGTDYAGREVLARIALGARTSLIVGFGAAFVGITIGALFGLMTGYVKGPIDLLGQRLVDAMMAIPSLIFAMVLAVFFQQSLTGIILAIGISMSPNAARILRSSALTVRETLYVDAARAVGCSGTRIVLRHILPNCMAPYLIILTAAIGSAIISEATLGYLGIGIPEPTPTWGGMLSRASTSVLHAPWEAAIPGIFITLTVLGFNLLGDALRDVLDPRMRGTR